jgi:hypothetical protein
MHKSAHYTESNTIFLKKVFKSSKMAFYLSLKDQAWRLFFTSEEKNKFSKFWWKENSKMSDLWPSWQKISQISKFSEILKTWTLFPEATARFGGLEGSRTWLPVQRNLVTSSGRFDGFAWRHCYKTFFLFFHWRGKNKLECSSLPSFSAFSNIWE